MGRPTKDGEKDLYLCGAGFFSTGTWDIFLPSCRLHDQAYMESEELYVDGFFDADEYKKSKALQDKMTADFQFAVDCRRIANSYNFLLRPFTRAWAELYIGLVFKLGLAVWFGSVIRRIEKRASELGIAKSNSSLESWGNLDRLLFVNSTLSGYRK